MFLKKSNHQQDNAYMNYSYRYWGVYFQFFFLECYGSDNQPLGTEQIYEQLKNIVNQSNEPDVPVGLLTTENRNKWAKAYELLAKGKQGSGDSNWLSANS